MYTSSAIATGLAVSITLASGAPTKRHSADGKYHGIGLALVTSPAGQLKVTSPAPVEIDFLTSLSNTSCYSIEFQSVHSNVDITEVECRAYKDESGQIPGSAPFNHKSPAYLSTNPVEIGSVLCYVVTDEEATAF